MSEHSATPAAGPAIAPGRTASVYVWGDPADDRVVKVYHGDWPEQEIAREARDATTAHALGVTPIGTHGRTEVDGAPGLVFDRVHGIALTTVAERNILRIGEVGRTLARVQAGMHAVHTDAFVDVREFAVGLLDAPGLARLTAAERAAVTAQLRALPAGASVLHLDCHPLNVFEHDGGHAIIDWQSACSGAPAADVAMTRVLFTEAELFPGLNALQRGVYQTVRGIMLRSYLAEYRRLTGITDAEVDRWMLAARVIRLGLLDIASERDAAIARIRADIATPTRTEGPAA